MFDLGLRTQPFIRFVFIKIIFDFSGKQFVIHTSIGAMIDLQPLGKNGLYVTRPVRKERDNSFQLDATWSSLAVCTITNSQSILTNARIHA